MIGDMISKLEGDAKSEASHKEYCDKEMGESAAKMDELSSSISRISAKKDKVQDLSAELAVISKSQAEADKLRQEEHGIFVIAKADLEQGVDAVRSALKVLREYYASDAALVQQPSAPGSDSAAGGAGAGIIDILEVIASDFGKNLAA